MDRVFYELLGQESDTGKQGKKAQRCRHPGVIPGLLTVIAKALVHPIAEVMMHTNFEAILSQYSLRDSIPYAARPIATIEVAEAAIWSTLIERAHACVGE